MAKPHNGETLAGLLRDPLIRAVMRADHVEPAELEASLATVAARLQRRNRSASVALVAQRREVSADTDPFLTSVLAERASASVCHNCVGW